MTGKAQNTVDLGPEAEILLDALVFAAASISLYVKAAGKMAGDSVYPVWSTKGAKMQQQGHAAHMLCVT